jgi:hypothetical protein
VSSWIATQDRLPEEDFRDLVFTDGTRQYPRLLRPHHHAVRGGATGGGRGRGGDRVDARRDHRLGGGERREEVSSMPKLKTDVGEIESVGQ